MARIAGINIPQNKLVHIGLTYIYGIGDKFSNQICSSLEIPKAKRINELTDDEILRILRKNFLKDIKLLKKVLIFMQKRIILVQLLYYYHIQREFSGNSE